MSHHRHELKSYRNQSLIDETNWMFVWIKKYIHLKDKYPNTPPPSVSDLDSLMNKIIVELKKDSKPLKP